MSSLRLKKLTNLKAMPFTLCGALFYKPDGEHMRLVCDSFVCENCGFFYKNITDGTLEQLETLLRATESDDGTDT